MVALWDTAQWDQGAEWGAAPLPPEGWGDDWAWWYQPGASGSSISLNGMVVEARWTTDSHTLGDGTFRGDLQPGTLTLQLWDPTHQLDNLDKYGAVWAWYKPTNQVWAWFYDSFTRGLVAPGDPAGADCVFSGVTWASRMTQTRWDTQFPAQSVSARIAALVAVMNSSAQYVHLPHVAANVANQSQTVPATVPPSDAPPNSSGYWPSYLAVLRDAAGPGVAWLSYSTPGDLGPGAMTVNYARWEAANVRTLDPSQIVAGPPVTASVDWLITLIYWTAINGSTGATSTMLCQGDNILYFGQSPTVPLRLWGNVTPPGGPQGAEYQAAYNTGYQVCTDRQDPTERTLSSVSLQSGTRWEAGGKPAKALWDPYAHTFSPTDVARINDGTGTLKNYRVTKSDHRLTSAVWETTHYLEKYTAATPLP